MSMWESAVPRLVAGEKLSYADSYGLMNEIMAGELGDIRMASFLSLLALRGISIDELHGMANSMRDRARSIRLPQDTVDIVGTGGDRAHTVNISTMASIVIAAVGVPVVKHGNRASTSASGSADVLEALGVNLQLTPEQIESIFPDLGLAFLFANSFHPSMRNAAAVRKNLAFPTVFNILGPLTNPARPRASAIGVARRDIAPLVAGVFAKRGTGALVFRGQDHGLDELTTVEPAEIWEVRDGEVVYHAFDPVEELGMARSSLSDLRGGSPQDNAAVAISVFRGESGPITDAVVLNAAAALVAAGSAGVPAAEADQELPLMDRLRGALEPVREALRSGAALVKLESWVEASNDISWRDEK